MNSPLRTLVIIVFVAFAFPTADAAEPYAPIHDNEVLETLPRSLLSSRDAINSLRRQLTADPTNASLAQQVAKHYVLMGNREGDPRFFGYARAAMKPWWDADSPPTPILRLRAKLREKEHQYDLALADQRRIVALEPRNSQAWIEIANILRVQGRYDEAKEACEQLSQFASRVPITLCRVPLQAATGEAQAAYDAVSADLEIAKRDFPSTVQWMVTMQAKIAQSLGRQEIAERHFREVLKSNPGDAYMMRDFADFLLDGGRESEALDMLREHTKDNGILLRAAIAARRCGEDALAKEWQERLESRFHEIRLRGGDPHGRFEARYALELLNSPKSALNLALANWAKQKETRDTRNVLEAALALEEPTAAANVIEFVNVSGTENVILRRLVERLEAIE